MRNSVLTKPPQTNDEALAVLATASPEWLGQFGEAIWSWILECAGWHYIPLAKIADGGAPMMRGASGPVICPDFDANKDGKNIYVEAKAKSQSIYYRKISKERHGINQNNYRHYMMMSEMRKQQCAIAIVELHSEHKPFDLRWSGTLLLETLKQLGPAAPGDFPESPPKVFWNRKQFSAVDAELTAIELFQLARRQLRRNYAASIDRILMPWKQGQLFS